MNNALLTTTWNPKHAGDRVLAGLVNVCAPQVKGAHDSDFVIVDGKAYIVYEANDVQPGEQPDWPFVYCALSVLDVASGRVEQTLTFAASEMRFDNETLPVGACFVPHLLQKDARTLRCFFASEDLRAGSEAQTWYRDYDLTRGTFDGCIHRAEIETDQGIFPMQPRAFHQHAAAKGFRGEPMQFGLYPVDGFKRFDGRVHAVLNNFPGGQLAWAVLNPALDRFTVLGDFFLPHEAKLTEAAVNRLPDGSWLAISRQENRDMNYMFAASPDGRTWTPHEYRPHVVNGTNSKPVFECFGGVYYLGWNEATQVNGAYRSVFNLDVSRDGIRWERKYRFETDKSFQYPTLREYAGAIYLTVTQGDYSDSRKERIMFGKLEDLEGACRPTVVGEQGDCPLPQGKTDDETAVARSAEAGDLLCEWFGHLAGYVGEKPHFLSGWEVEPVGQPYDYAYYQWFKLVATETRQPVTIRKRFVAQAAGVVTWEFRFRLPVVADGPSFALQAGGQDVLRLRVTGVALAAELAGEPPVHLAALRPDQSYGIRAQLDLTARRVMLWLDGQPAAALRLAEAVGALDGIRITTGPGFVGELFLGPILLHRGYALRERFLFTCEGAVPSGWSAVSDGGRVGLRRIGGAAHPADNRALCLEQFQAGGLSATAACPPLAGAVAAAVSWWIPEGGDGAAVELLNETGAVVATLAVAGRDFVGRGGDGANETTRLWTGWQPTVWYDLECELDPVAGTAACRINGIPRGVFRIQPYGSITGLRLRTAGREAATVWADRFSLRPHAPWPADYPPEPKPVATGETLVLMQSCDLWREGAHVGWDCLRAHPERKPLLGYYNGGDPEVEDWAILWLAENGIACDFKCWYRGQPGFPVHSLRHGEGLHGFKHARWSDKLRFAVNVTNHFDMFTSLDDWRRHVVPYLVEHLFRDPRYLVVDGKPFVAIYDPHWLDRNTGDAGAALACLRTACVEAGFAGCWLIGQHRDNEADKLADFARWGIDAVYAYTWYARNGAQQADQLAAHRARGLVDILPTLSMGWDLRPWGGADLIVGDGVSIYDGRYWLKPAEFRELCAWARETYMPAGATDALSRRIVMLDNWNEFGEGHCLMPCAGWHFGYLHAARDVFGQPPFPPAVLPTPAQAARLATLYPEPSEEMAK